jgi:hypothetical protein
MKVRVIEPTHSRADPALRAIFDLAEHLDSGRRIPEDSRALLAKALRAGIASSFEEPFYAAVGVRTWGGVSPFRKVALSRRDRMLCRLKRIVPEWADLTPAAAAKAMTASAARYESIRWPRERHAIGGPAVQPFATWWSFLRAEMKLPGEKRLSQILASETQDDFEFPQRSITLPAKGDDDGENTQD